MRITRPAFAFGRNGEGFRQKSVAGQNCNAFTKNFVIRRLAPAKVVVIHGRQIVVDERNKYEYIPDRARQWQSRFDAAAASFRRRQAKRRTHPLAARKNRVAHRLVNRGRFRAGRWQKMI